MHIAAYVAACEIWDLDRNAKLAVLAVSGRANRYTAAADVPVRRLARDMGLEYSAARLAVQRAITAGYLAVDKRPGTHSVIRLDLPRLGVGSRADARTGSRADARGVRALAREQEENLDKDIGGAPPRRTGVRTARPVEKQPRGGEARRILHPPSCACDGTGWVGHPGGEGVIRCPGVSPVADSEARRPSKRRGPGEGATR